MDRFVIRGGRRIEGTLRVGGAKNAALPILAACVLTDQECVVRDVPRLRDVGVMIGILRRLGAEVSMEDRRDGEPLLRVRARTLADPEIPESLVRRMRSSIFLMGPLLGRLGRVRLSYPGGCAIGDRPVNLHIRAIQQLGADVELVNGDICAKAKRLRGTEMFLGGPFGSTVLGTANAMMAAVLAEGVTVIEMAACEPEVVDLANFLNRCGASITGHGTPRSVIEGGRELHGCEYRIIPDRIEAGTLMVAAAITNGEITLENCRLDHLMAFVDRMTAIGVNIEKTEQGVTVSSARRLEPVDVTTQPFPGFPTDLQAQIMALLCLAEGNSIITEKIFPDRFMHVAELNRMGARLRKEGPTVIVEGVKRLIGAPVMASDLRASAALVLAGLAARGVTRVNRIYHLLRGYDRFDEKLRSVGADIQRKEGDEPA